MIEASKESEIHVVFPHLKAWVIYLQVLTIVSLLIVGIGLVTTDSLLIYALMLRSLQFL